MSTQPPSDRAAVGRERLAARERRISLIRRRVAASVLATFVLAWGVIAWDGSMGNPNTTTAQVSSASTGNQTSSSDDRTGSSENPTGSSEDSTSSDGSSPDSTNSAPSMTTRQS